MVKQPLGFDVIATERNAPSESGADAIASYGWIMSNCHTEDLPVQQDDSWDKPAKFQADSIFFSKSDLLVIPTIWETICPFLKMRRVGMAWTPKR